MTCCADGLWPSQDNLQPVHQLEPPRRVQPYLRRTRSQGWQAGSVDDRRHPPEGTSHSGKPPKRGSIARRIVRTKGGLNSKRHAVCDGNGRPLIMLLNRGQKSEYKGAALMIDAFPKAKALLADRRYDADWFRSVLEQRGITPCIPS